MPRGLRWRIKILATSAAELLPRRSQFRLQCHHIYRLRTLREAASQVAELERKLDSLEVELNEANERASIVDGIDDPACWTQVTWIQRLMSLRIQQRPQQPLQPPAAAP
jgi:plasmid stabilization system protein ParE